MRLIDQGLHLGPRTVGDHTQTAQMIPMPIVDNPIRDCHRCNAGIASPDEPAATGGGPGCVTLIELTDIAGRRGAHDFLYAPPLAVIDEGGGTALHDRERFVLQVLGCHYYRR